MANSLSFNKSPKSKLKRLSMLPRFGFTVDFAGYEFSYRQAPILEALMNLRGKSISLQTLLDISLKQLEEIKIKPDIENSKG